MTSTPYEFDNGITVSEAQTPGLSPHPAERLSSITYCNDPNDCPLPYFEKTPEQLKFLEAAVARSYPFLSCAPEVQRDLLLAMHEVKAAKGHILVTQGGELDGLFVVVSGSVSSYFRRPEYYTTTPDEHPIYGKKEETYAAGTAFGELMSSEFAWFTTLVADTDCTLWTIGLTLSMTVRAVSEYRMKKMYEKLIRELPVFEALDDAECAHLSTRVHVQRFKDGEQAAWQGNGSRTLHIVAGGRAVLSRCVNGVDGEVREVVGELRKGDYYGVEELLYGAPAAVAIHAMTRETDRGYGPDSDASPVALHLISIEAFSINKSMHSRMIRDRKKRAKAAKPPRRSPALPAIFATIAHTTRLSVFQKSRRVAVAA
ncbi:hypothetical protein BOTBODRAFT_179528 [Botryobasidium botryosum FD-172 SS1]|uniref:Cyclic nucleotide-binding domain-containing protein n=1 Tax=Botryobasidium botryosum (strain FD-172 SS1) TaxID=930990 RepID=A0A067MAM9_BOTB1|nr:hypothetical protein BOTBODRAFT_179528 [Botryobasidium botryosum FD-172 SS1]